MPVLDRRLQAGQRIATAQTRLQARREEEEQPSVIQIANPNPIQVVQPELSSQPIEQQTLLQPSQSNVINPQPQAQQPQGGGVLGTISQLGSLASSVKGVAGLFGGGGGAIGTVAGVPVGTSIGAGAGSIGTVAGVPVGASIGSSVAPAAAGLPAGVAASLFTGLGGFAFPAAAIALPALNIATQGSRNSLKARIGFNESGRPTVVDADAKGDLTSSDADALGREAVLALDSVRRELGAEFNTDVGDFGLIGGKPGSFRVQDINFIKGKGDPNIGVIGTFTDLNDAKEAFVAGALRSGALKGDQDKINAKIKELAPVFKKDRHINQFQDTGIVGGTKEVAPSLNQFLQAIKQTDDPASVLSQSPGPLELIPNPRFVGGPEDSEPMFIPKANPFLALQPPPKVLPEGFARGGI